MIKILKRYLRSQTMPVQLPWLPIMLLGPLYGVVSGDSFKFKTNLSFKMKLDNIIHVCYSNFMAMGMRTSEKLTFPGRN